MSMPTFSQSENRPVRRSRESSRIRPAEQEKLLTARMSEPDRQFVKDMAHARGLSVAEYVLTLARNDSRSVSLFGRPGAATVSEDNSTTAEGPRRVDEVPHAKADLAVTAAVG